MVPFSTTSAPSAVDRNDSNEVVRSAASFSESSPPNEVHWGGASVQPIHREAPSIPTNRRIPLFNRVPRTISNASAVPELPSRTSNA